MGSMVVLVNQPQERNHDQNFYPAPFRQALGNLKYGLQLDELPTQQTHKLHLINHLYLLKSIL